MAKLNRWDVLTKIDEQSGATREKIAEALGGDAERQRIDDAFESAQRHALIESRAGDDGVNSWELSEKGKRKLAART